MEHVIKKEVELWANESPDFNVEDWKSLNYNIQDRDVAISHYGTIGASMDMGWQKRPSGRRFDSLSGHAIVVGAKSRKSLAYEVKSRFCRTCSNQGDEVPEHNCPVNHSGSAGSMEGAALVDMFHRLFDSKDVLVACFITDDDSKMKAQLRWSNEDYKRHHGNRPKETSKNGSHYSRTNHGKLRYPIPESLFLADPAHRKKTLRNKLYDLLKVQKSSPKYVGIVEADILRITRNFAYMSRQLPHTDKDEWLSAGKAVLEHHFGNHQYCVDICIRKKELAKNIID